jgi:hypothetical protein
MVSERERRAISMISARQTSKRFANCYGPGTPFHHSRHLGEAARDADLEVKIVIEPHMHHVYHFSLAVCPRPLRLG